MLTAVVEWADNRLNIHTNIRTYRLASYPNNNHNNTTTVQLNRQLCVRWFFFCTIFQLFLFFLFNFCCCCYFCHWLVCSCCWCCCCCYCAPLFIILYGVHLKFSLCFIKKRCAGANFATKQRNTHIRTNTHESNNKNKATLNSSKDNKHNNNNGQHQLFVFVCIRLWQPKADKSNIIYLKQLVNFVFVFSCFCIIISCH